MADFSYKDTIAAQWSDITERAAASSSSLALKPLVEAAQKNKVLFELFPFLSMGRLCFSRCTDFPYYVDIVISPTDPVEDIYAVETTLGEGGWADTKVIARVKKASAAVEMATSLLPKGYGPARSGNADEWRSEFNEVAKLFRGLAPPLEEH